MSSQERKSAFLGMPYGTACHRLRKLVLFDLLRRYGDNVCYKCREAIVSPDELSLEHKQPWEGRDQALFWDLSNIAFSHRRCNTTETYRGGHGAPRKQGPEGTAWCNRCRKFLATANFRKNITNWNGLQNRCRECQLRHSQSRVKRRRAEVKNSGAVPKW